MQKVMLLGLALVMSVPFASATSLEDQLRKSYVGTQRMLRHFYDSDALKFDSNGNPGNTGKEGPWTLLGGVIIDSLHLKSSGKLELQGRRRMLVFEAANKKLLNFALRQTFWIEVQTQDRPPKLTHPVYTCSRHESQSSFPFAGHFSAPSRSRARRQPQG
jgi:hypothetical protein